MGIGFFLIWYSVGTATPAERQILWSNIKNADPLPIFLSLLCGLLSHLSRAYRWQYPIRAMGYKTSFKNKFMAVMAGYLANLGVPRSGEMLRGALLASYEEIPFEKTLGTIIAERLADLVVLIVIVVITFSLQSQVLLEILENQNIDYLTIILVLAVLGAAGILAYYLLMRSNNPFFKKVAGFVNGLIDGIKSILKMKHKMLFIAHTLFIWAMYIMMFWVIKFSVPEMTSVGIGTILVAFIAGSISMSASNGGIGAYPFAIGTIFVLFGYSKEGGEAYGWLLWGTQTLLVIVLGALSFWLLPLLNQKK